MNHQTEPQEPVQEHRVGLSAPKHGLIFLHASTLPMLMALSLLSFFPSEVWPADYYVAKNGSDSNPGTEALPYLTIQAALDAATPGDTVLVGAGDYPERIDTVRAGSPGKPITLDGQSVASFINLDIEHAHITLQNFTLKGETTQFGALLWMRRGAHFCNIRGNIFDAEFASKVDGINWEPGSTTPFATDAGSDNLIENNVIRHIKASTMLSMMGDRNVVRNNQLLDSTTVDFVRLWGRNNLISHNLFANNWLTEGLGNHPDFIQTFGLNGHGSMGHIIEGNIIDGIEGGQITQLTNALLPEIGDWTFRNNVFMNIAMQASCSIPNVKYYNNTFYRCNFTNGGHVLSFGSRDFKEHQSYNSTSGTSFAHGAEIINNAFIDCGDITRTNTGWYGVAITLDNVVVDYNFVSKLDGPVKENADKIPVGDPSDAWVAFRWWEPNGINGGKPGLLNAPDGDFTLLPESPLIDSGDRISSVLVDSVGIERPQGMSHDIGAFEYYSDSSGPVPASPGDLTVTP